MRSRPVSGARTPLFGALRRAWRIAAAQRRPGAPPVDEAVAIEREAVQARLDRRQFLKLAGAGAAGLALSPALAGCAPLGRVRTDARVAIVGGGMAGLNAAYRLKRAGVASAVYEASDRTGGRMYTATGLVGPGLTTELGGEFIDSGHVDILNLVREFGLPLYDVESPSETALIKDSYFFNGRQYSLQEIIQAFQPYVARITADVRTMPNTIVFDNYGAAGPFDIPLPV